MIGQGKHCWRMYYKIVSDNQWLLFGIYKFGTKPRNKDTNLHVTSWGFAGTTNKTIYCNGNYEYDKSRIHLYSLNENQIDMFVDFDNGILSYATVVDDDDDKEKERKYTFKERFNTSINYTVHLNFGTGGETEAQIAKIDVSMFGKNKNLVRWSKQNY